MAEEKKKEITFPVTYNKCPICGETEIITNVVREKFGNPRTEGEPELAIAVIPVPVASRAEILMGLEVPFMDIYLNVCANPDCGCVYPRRIDVAKRPTKG